MFKRVLLWCGLALMASGCVSHSGGGHGAGMHHPGEMMARVVMEEFRVTSDPGIQIYVRNKRPAGVTQFTADKTVVYVHGATYPSETAFDLKLDGFSWMDYMAQRGYDVYLLDVRGYGQSTRPPQMDKPAKDSPPFGGTIEAMRDVDAVVEFVKKRNGISKMNLLAWSWGDIHHAVVYQPQQRQGQQADFVRTGMDSSDRIAGASRARPDPRLPRGAQGSGQSALADRRAG